MKIRLNSKELETSATTISELVKELALPYQGVAVAVDNCLVPRTEWNDFKLSENISLLIIKAASGG